MADREPEHELEHPTAQSRSPFGTLADRTAILQWSSL